MTCHNDEHAIERAKLRLCVLQLVGRLVNALCQRSGYLLRVIDKELCDRI